MDVEGWLETSSFYTEDYTYIMSSLKNSRIVQIILISFGMWQRVQRERTPTVTDVNEELDADQGNPTRTVCIFI